jgi:Mg-chelatase subunit ChlD
MNNHAISFGKQRSSRPARNLNQSLNRNLSAHERIESRITIKRKSSASIILVVCVLVLDGLLAPSAFSQDVSDNVVIVLDGSGSMARAMPGGRIEKMAAAKAALKQVVASIPQSTRIGLLVFSANGVDDDWVYPLGPRDDARLMQAIDRPRPGRGTPLGAYLKKGADRLLEERAKQFGYGTFRLLVVTDGEAEDQGLVDRYTPEIIARGITVDVIGVAMNQRHTLATRVHSYRPANDPASLKRAVAEVFGEIGGRGKDVASAEAFAELKSIPAEVVQAAIQALSSSGNQPIGQQPRPIQTPARPSTKPQVSPQQSPVSPPAAAQPASAPRPSPPAPSPARGFALLPILAGLSCFGLFGFVILVLFIRAAKKSRQ